jgi:prolyl 4-hydroxylase
VHIPPNEISLTYLHAFLTTEECAELIMLSQGQFEHSRTSGGVVSSKRTSHSAPLPEYVPLVRRIFQHVSELTKAPDYCIEEINVVRYEPGQQYHPHFDSSWYDWPVPRSRPRREFILFVYLNTMPANAGGETEFTNIGVKFSPKADDALFWRNHKDRNSPHLLDGRHAGRPPLSGIKYGQSESRPPQLCGCDEASARL